MNAQRFVEPVPDVPLTPAVMTPGRLHRVFGVWTCRHLDVYSKRSR
jgi:hypothetical protein